MRLLGATADERATRVLERLIHEAEDRLREIYRLRERRWLGGPGARRRAPGGEEIPIRSRHPALARRFARASSTDSIGMKKRSVMRA
jgi:hypothetical protein